MTAMPMPGLLLLENPGYARFSNLTLKGYIPLIDAYDCLVGVTDILILSTSVTFLTGMINFLVDQLHLQLL